MYYWCLQSASPRSKAEPEGKHSITTEKECKTLRLANLITKNTFQLAMEYYKQGVLVSIENPGTSLIWITRACLQFIKATDAKFVTIDYCMYGEPWKKRTKILVAGKNGLPKEKRTNKYNVSHCQMCFGLNMSKLENPLK